MKWNGKILLYTLEVSGINKNAEDFIRVRVNVNCQGELGAVVTMETCGVKQVT